MNQEELMAKIDRYDWELMPESERQLMEKEMREDPDFRSQVMQRQLENTAIKQLRQQALQAKMKAWRAESVAETKTEVRVPEVVEEAKKEPTKVVPLSPLRVLWFTPMQWAAAASFALLVVFGGNYWVKNNYGNAALFADVSKKRGDLQKGSVGFGAGTVAENDPVFFEAGNAVFDSPNPNYAEAIEQYNKLVGEDYITQSRMLLAEAYFQLGDYEKATAIYEGILKAKKLETNVLQQAVWRLVVNYLAANKAKGNPNFTLILGEIANNSVHPFHKEALELSQKVNSFWWRLAN